MSDTQNYARIAYEAYVASANGKTWDGRDIPDWSAIGPEVQRHWAAAAAAVVGFREFGTPEPAPTVAPVDLGPTEPDATLPEPLDDPQG